MSTWESGRRSRLRGQAGGGGQSMCGWWPITRTFTFALSDVGAIGGFEQRNALINEGFGRIALAASGEERVRELG